MVNIGRASAWVSSKWQFSHKWVNVFFFWAALADLFMTKQRLSVLNAVSDCLPEAPYDHRTTWHTSLSSTLRLLVGCVCIHLVPHYNSCWPPSRYCSRSCRFSPLHRLSRTQTWPGFATVVHSLRLPIISFGFHGHPTKKLRRLAWWILLEKVLTIPRYIPKVGWLPGLTFVRLKPERLFRLWQVQLKQTRNS